MGFNVNLAAERLLQAHNRGETYKSVFENAADGDISTGYDVQENLVHLFREQTGAGIAGYKIALTSAVMQEMCGVDHPVAGVIFDNVVFPSGETIRLADYQHVGVEFELAVRLGADMPARGEPYSRSDVAPFVDACAPAFELVEDRHADYATLEGPGLAADNAWNAGVVLGEYSGAWRDADLSAVSAALDWTGSETATTSTGEAMGHPFEAVAWIANHLNARGSLLKAGQFVMTGSTLKTRFPGGGELIRYSLNEIGSVEAVII